MSKNRKYHYAVEKKENGWQATIIRQASSRKTVVSKRKDAFSDEQSAQHWAEQTLKEFTATQGASNIRHTQQRKLNEEQRRHRSARRAEKTEQAKLERDETDQQNPISSD